MVPSTSSPDRMAVLSAVEAQRRRDLIAVLDIITKGGYTTGMAAGRLYGRIVRYFEMPIARCKDCKVWKNARHFPAWSDTATKRAPTFFTRLACRDCQKKRKREQPARVPKIYHSVGSIAGQAIDFHYAARSPKEAAGFIFRRYFPDTWKSLSAEKRELPFYLVRKDGEHIGDLEIRHVKIPKQECKQEETRGTP